MSIALKTIATCLCIWVASGAAAQNYSPNDLNAMRQSVVDATSTALTRLEAARDNMRAFTSENPTEQEAEINQFFDEIEGEARSILDKIHPTSDFIDALSATRDRLIVLRERFERDPPSARRDQRLSRLEGEITRFNGIYDQITQMESKLVGTIIRNNEAKNQVLRDLDVMQAVEVVDVLALVADDLANVVSAIEDVSGQAQLAESGTIALE